MAKKQAKSKSFIRRAYQIYVDSPVYINSRELAKMVGASSFSGIAIAMREEGWEQQRKLKLEQKANIVLEQDAKKNEHVLIQNNDTVKQFPTRAQGEPDPQELLVDLYMKGRAKMAKWAYAIIAKYGDSKEGHDIDEDIKISTVVQRASAVFTSVYDGGQIPTLAEEDHGTPQTISFDEQLKKIAGE